MVSAIVALNSELVDEVRLLKEALKWYADPGNYMVNDDQVATAYERGRLAVRAQEALATERAKERQ